MNVRRSYNHRTSLNDNDTKDAIKYASQLENNIRMSINKAKEYSVMMHH